MPRNVFCECRLLIVDDERSNVTLLEKVLEQNGYENVRSTTDPTEALDIYREFSPDLVLLDLHMPVLDGHEIMTRLRTETSGRYLPILVLTADVTPQTKRKALSSGATDFLTKPFDVTEVALRLRNLLETRVLHDKLARQNENLEEMVQDRTSKLWQAVTRLEAAEEELRVSRADTIKRLSIAAEFRDVETVKHVHRMSEFCAAMADTLGYDDDRREQFRIASQMHDVGKIGIPDSILLKPGPLTPAERANMERHAEIGYRILEGSEADLLKTAAVIAYTHHERYDGKGYPRRLSGPDIPVEGRIAAIADVFDALTSDRVYRPAYPVDEAIEMLVAGKGTQFDSALVDLFLNTVGRRSRATNGMARRAG